jgi:serine/threonine protein phosphatase PrpC
MTSSANKTSGLMEDFSQGNTGYSGTPLWKLRQNGLSLASQIVTAAQEEALSRQQQPVDDQGESKHTILATGSAISGGKGPQMVRHVIAKDLKKVANAMGIGSVVLFEGAVGPRSLFALFDGQSGTAPGSKSPEWCCRNFPLKLIRNLASLPSIATGQPTLVKAALLKSFGDLEKDLSESGVEDRCGASVALLLGETLYTAVLGNCGAILCQKSDEVPSCTPRERRGTAATVSSGKVQRTVVSLTNRAAQGAPAAPGQALEVKGTPSGTLEVRDTTLDSERQPFIVLCGTLVCEIMAAHELVDICTGFLFRPRASAGEIAAQAMTRRQCAEHEGQTVPGSVAGLTDSVALVMYMRPEEQKLEPTPAKKSRTEPQRLESVRLRHILVRHRDLKASDPSKVHQTRAREDAETALRAALTELLKDGNHVGDSMWAVKSTPRILSVCKAHSECTSAQKGGSHCGDLGWLGKKDLQAMGKDFLMETVQKLRIAEWSDLLNSEHGIHLVMRIA